jgi:hypothetical protein
MLLENLALCSAMVVATVTLHFFGLAALIAALNADIGQKVRDAGLVLRGFGLIAIVLLLVGVHALEIWAYAGLYVGLHEIPKLEDALYYSTSAFATLSAPDRLLGHDHRLIGAVEGVNGFLLIGWSTAFLVSVTAKMGLLEASLRGEAARSKARDDEQP